MSDDHHSRIYRWLDDRLDLEGEMLGKPFPHDPYGSFLLGEVALFSFIILAATGTFLGLLYAPVAKEVLYTGQAAEYTGNKVPGAFASVLRITYDVRFGMFNRMAHHWAAYIFVASISLHMFRVFFTGSYRNPREPNWLVGATLLLLALVEGFFGYALPYDNFSKTATVIGFNMTESIPVIGNELVNLLFGGNFPANAPYVLPRMFFYHVFLLPAIIVGLVGVHMAILFRQKHTEDPLTRREAERHDDVDVDDQSVIVGAPMFPNQAAFSAIVFLFTASIVSFLAAFFPVQRIALLGPATPFKTPRGVGPDWFFMWVFGSLKMMPSGLPKSSFIGGVLIPSLVIGAMYLWVFVDRSQEPVQFIDNPLDRPLPTAVGVAAIQFIIVLSIDGMNLELAEILGMTTEALFPYLLAMTIGVPLVSFGLVYLLLRRRVHRMEVTS